MFEYEIELCQSMQRKENTNMADRKENVPNISDSDFTDAELRLIYGLPELPDISCEEDQIDHQLEEMHAWG